jgi:predicted RNA-binding Zn ribbon-like protein
VNEHWGIRLFPLPSVKAIARGASANQRAIASLARGVQSAAERELLVALRDDPDPPHPHTSAVTSTRAVCLNRPRIRVTIVYHFSGDAKQKRLSEMQLTLRSVAAHGGAQPGGREPAPAELRLVQEFVNSRWDLDRGHREQWSSPAALARWLIERELLEPGAIVSEADLNRSLLVREGLRALFFANNGAPMNRDAVERLNQALRGPGLSVQLAPAAPPDFLARDRDLDAALAMVATTVAVAQLEGSWQRLKACRGEHCGWTFYDYSRNQGSNWCAMSVCGSRAKARAYRRRKGRPRAA